MIIKQLKGRRWSGVKTIKSHAPPSKPNGKESHLKLTKPAQDTHSRLNEHSFPNRWSFNFPNIKTAVISFLPIFYLKTETNLVETPLKYIICWEWDVGFDCINSWSFPFYLLWNHSILNSVLLFIQWKQTNNIILRQSIFFRLPCFSTILKRLTKKSWKKKSKKWVSKS